MIIGAATEVQRNSGHPHRDSERFFAFMVLACGRLCYNRLPCAVDARSP